MKANVIMKYFTRKIAGFTLVETLVAILALSLSLGALTIVVSKSFQTTRDGLYRMQAEFLAVEGIEMIQQFAMSRMLRNDLDPFLQLSTFCANGCIPESFITEPIAPLVCTGLDLCSSGKSAEMYISANGKFTYQNVNATGKASGLYRLVKVEQIGNGSYVVSSIVAPKSKTSNTADLTRAVVLTKESTNWYSVAKPLQ